jgi:phage tail protein X
MTTGQRIAVTEGARGSSIYRTDDDDMLDHVAWRFYGRDSGAAEIVIAANPHLLGHGPRLPAGLDVTLPPIAVPTVPTIARVRLFD